MSTARNALVKRIDRIEAQLIPEEKMEIIIHGKSPDGAIKWCLNWDESAGRFVEV